MWMASLYIASCFHAPNGLRYVAPQQHYKLMRLCPMFPAFQDQIWLQHPPSSAHKLKELCANENHIFHHVINSSRVFLWHWYIETDFLLYCQCVQRKILNSNFFFYVEFMQLNYKIYTNPLGLKAVMGWNMPNVGNQLKARLIHIHTFNCISKCNFRFRWVIVKNCACRMEINF